MPTYAQEVAAFKQRAALFIADVTTYAFNGGGPGGGERATRLALRLSDFLTTLGDAVLPPDRTLRLIHLLNDQLAYYPNPLTEASAPAVSFVAPASGSTALQGASVLLRIAATDAGSIGSVEVVTAAGASLGFATLVGSEYQLAVTIPQTTGALALTARATNAQGLVGTATLYLSVGQPAVAPGIPTACTATLASGGVSVTAAAPANSGGSLITGYTVYVNGDTQNPVATNVALPYLYTAGAAGASAYFQVAAVNAVGTGLPSPVSNTVTLPNATPAAPTVTADDAADTLAFASPLGAGELVVSTNGGLFVAYTGPISVGNVARPAGYYQCKVKAASGRNESAVTSSPAFTVAATPPPVTATFDLSQAGAPGIGLNLLEVQKTNYVSRSPFATFTVTTDHTSAAVTVNVRGVAATTPYVYVFSGSTLVGVAQTSASVDDATRPTQLVTATINNLPAGTKTLTFRSGASQYTDATIGYVESAITQVVLSGGTTATAQTPTRKANFFAFLGDSIWSSVDPAGVDGGIGLVPKLRAALPAYDVLGLSGSGGQLVQWYASAAQQQVIAQQVVAAASGYAGKKFLYIELQTNDFGAGTGTSAYRQALESITDRVRTLDPTIRMVWQTATYRNIQATPIGGQVLEDFRQVMRDAAVGRNGQGNVSGGKDYVVVLEGEPIVSQGNFYQEAQVVHPNPAGQDQLVAAIVNLLNATPAAQGTGVYVPPVVQDAVIRDYQFTSDATDSTTNHLDLTPAGTGAAPTYAGGYVMPTNGQYLLGAGSAKDAFPRGIQVDFSFQYAGNSDTYHTIARYFGKFEVGLKLTAGNTMGQVELAAYDANGQKTTVASQVLNVAAASVSGSAAWVNGVLSLRVAGGNLFTAPLSSLKSSLAEFRVGESFTGSIDYVTITSTGSANSGGGAQPVLSSASPASAAQGSSITLAGSNFGASQGGSSVVFTNTATSATATAAVTSWADASVACTVPTTLGTGACTIQVLTNASASNALSFTINSTQGVARQYALATDFLDSSGNHLDLAPAGTGPAPAFDGTGLLFAAAGQYLQSAGTYLDDYSQGYAYSLEVQLTSPLTSYTGLLQYSSNFYLYAADKGGNMVSFQAVAKNASGQEVVAESPAVNALAWNQVAVAWDGSTLSVRVNGGSPVTTPLASLLPVAPGSDIFKVGIGPAVGSYSNYLRNVTVSN